MELRSEVINRILSNTASTLIVMKRSAKDLEYEYILDGIEFAHISLPIDDDNRHFHIHDKRLARFFQYNFLSDVAEEDKPEAIYVHYLREKFIEVFHKADERGYNECRNKIEERIRPYQNTDARVTRAIWNILQESMTEDSKEVITLSTQYIYNSGYRNGLIRMAAELICEHPDMFFDYPNLLVKHRAIDYSKSYYFSDIFWSEAARGEAVDELSTNGYLSDDGQTWTYRQKGYKTNFIAMFEELYVKDYLKKRLSNLEIKNIAMNSFDIDISERTFNEGAAIIQAQKKFKFLPVHKRFLGGDKDEYDEVYKRK